MKDLFGRDPDGSPGMALSRRRALLALGAMGALGLGIAIIPQWRRLVSPGRVVEVGALARTLVPLSRDERAQMGHAILAADGHRSHLREIAGVLDRLVVLRGTDLLASRGDTKLLIALGERIRADFAAGRILMIDRWYISRTQGDLLALAASRATSPARGESVGAAT